MTPSALSPTLTFDLPPGLTRQRPSTLTELNGQLSLSLLNIRPWDRVYPARHGRLLQTVATETTSGSHFYFQEAIDPQELDALSKIDAGNDFQQRLSIVCRLAEDTPPEVGLAAQSNAIVEIRWLVGGTLPPLLFFKQFSDAGVWNHLVMDNRAARQNALEAFARHPNIVHSWETGGNIDIHGPYDAVRPLPGRPLWQVLTDPVQRFLLVDRWGQKQLLRLRLDADGEHIYAAGEALDFRFIPPDRLPEGYLDEICAMVSAGGSVATTHVRTNLERAHLVGVVTEKGVIVGNSSLKNPRPAYIQSVYRRTGLDLTGFVERGYTSVRPEYRGLGIGTRLLEGLTQRAGERRIFSVIGEDNEATKTIARRNRTRQVAAYFSPQAGKNVGIWMPEGTVPRTGRTQP